MEKDSGVMVIDLAGNPIAHYHDPELSLISSGMKIGNYLYCGSVYYPYILRLNLKQYPERGTEWAWYPWENKTSVFVVAALLMVPLK